MCHHVQQAAGRGNHHVCTAAQCHQLWVDGYTTREHRHLGAAAHGFAYVVDQLGHLRRQLTCGHQDQRLRAARALALGGIAEQPLLQQGQDIGRCLARASGRAGAQIVAVQNGRNGLRLHGSGCNQSLRSSSMCQRRRKAKGRKGHGQTRGCSVEKQRLRLSVLPQLCVRQGLLQPLRGNLWWMQCSAKG